MKALVVGCGSIGRGHLCNLINLGSVESVFVYTKVPQCLEGLDSKDKVRIVDSLDDVKVDFAVIANETYKHLSTATFLAEKGINLFIEKPLSHNLDGVDSLKELVERKNLKAFVGYNLRFLGAIGYIKEQISKGVIGDLYFAKIEAGQYLPLWRPGRDYRSSYSVSRERGGGVSLDLSHEVDYMRFLFGEPCHWKVVKTKVGKLNIDSEDVFEGIFRYDSGFICNVHMDYLQMDKKREIRVVGSKGTLLCDFAKKNLKITEGERETTLDDANIFDVNKTYLTEMEHFIKSVEEGRNPGITLEDGIKALKLLEDGDV